MLTFLATIGAVFLGFLAATGRLVVFAGLTLATVFSPPVYPRAILREMVHIGYFYLPILFKLPSTDLLGARVLLLIAGTGMAFSFPFNVFMGILEVLERFASLGLTQVCFTLLRGALMVISLNR